MKDYFGKFARPGDTIVYPVIRQGELVMHDAMVIRRSDTERNGKPGMDVLVNRPGKQPWKTTLHVEGRFIVVKEGR